MPNAAGSKRGLRFSTNVAGGGCSPIEPNAGGLGVRGPDRARQSLTGPGCGVGGWREKKARVSAARTTTPRMPREASLQTVARAGRAGPGGVERAGTALRLSLCGSRCCRPAQPVWAAGGRTGEERRGRAVLSGGRDCPGHAGRRAGEGILRPGSARSGTADAPRAPHSAAAAGPHLDGAPRGGADAG